jgi:hypothetical protein
MDLTQKISLEIYEKIFRYIDYETLKNLSMSSKFFYNASSIDKRFQNSKIKINSLTKSTLKILNTIRNKNFINIEINFAYADGCVKKKFFKDFLRFINKQRRVSKLFFKMPLRYNDNENIWNLKTLIILQFRLFDLDVVYTEDQFFLPKNVKNFKPENNLKTFLYYQTLTRVSLHLWYVPFLGFLTYLLCAMQTRDSYDINCPREIFFLQTSEHEKKYCLEIFKRLPKDAIYKFFISSYVEKIYNFPTAFSIYLPYRYTNPTQVSDITFDTTYT